MRKVIVPLFVTLILFYKVADGATWSSVSAGNFNSAGTWGKPWPGSTIGAGDTVIINHVITRNVNLSIGGTLIINASGDLQMTGNRSIDTWNNAVIINNGALVAHNFTLNNNANYTGSGDLDINNNLTLNSSSSFSSNASRIDIGNNFQWNGSSSFSMADSVIVGNNFSKNGSSTFNLDGYMQVDNNVELNGGTTAIGTSGGLKVDGNTNYNGNNFNNAGDFETTGNFNSNGSNDFNNSGDVIVGNNFQNNGGIQNSGTISVTNALNTYSTFVNNGNIILSNGGENSSTFSGNGNLQINGTFNNWGTITGSMDICNPVGSSPTIGGNAPTGSSTICNNPSNFPLDNPVPLPVIWGKVSVTSLLPEGIKINWQVYAQLNNHFFDVEASYNGIDFFNIGTVNGCGSCDFKSYDYTWDIEPQEIVYFRIKQVDFDNQFDYSETVAVNQNRKVSSKCDITTLTSLSSTKGFDRILVFNLAGQLVFELSPTSSNSFDEIPSGLTFLQFESQSQHFTCKIIR